MTIQPVNTDKAPAAIGPYSQAIQTDGKLYTSGQLPIDPATGKIVEGSIDRQAHQALSNLQAIAEAAGTSLSQTVKTTVFLKDIADFQAVNEVYKEYFSQPFPARSAYQVAALPLGAMVEIEAVITI